MLSQAGVRVRLAAAGDVGRILAIERASAGAAHWSESDYQKALAGSLAGEEPRRVLLVAEYEGQVEGFLAARSGHPAEWEIENIAVAAAARRLGLGSSLLGAFVEQAQARNARGEGLEIHLEVRESNAAARHFYERAGFLLDKRRRQYYRQPEEDALLYRLSFQ